jgi:HD-GYP domain-containing protein (c-di-GMP phosphodiesterase class II)
MLLDDFENLLTLLAAVMGLLACLFRFIRTPRRGYFLLIIFYLANYLSDYYWTIYSLVMRSYPTVSEFLAYLGWNIGYLVLLFTTIHMRRDAAKKYFHPLLLLPVLTNTLQFILYIQYGGLFNNLWQVGITTIIMVICAQEVVFYFKNKNNGAAIPHFAIVTLLFLLTEYAMWTSSCFEWPGEFLNPYHYLTVIDVILKVMIAYAATMDYGVRTRNRNESSLVEFRYQILFQSTITLIIFGASVGGYVLANALKESVTSLKIGTTSSDRIVILLFTISSCLSFLILLFAFIFNRRYKTLRSKRLEMDQGKRSRFSFIIIIAITFMLMLFVVIYNTTLLYQASVTEINEDAKDVVKSTAAELENYITTAKTTLRVVADTIDLMNENGVSADEVERYLTNQTQVQAEHFDDNFTGIYAYFDGTFMDGSGWIPPEGYDPTTRDWYKAALKADGEIAIVPPYLDADTGDIVITFAKLIKGDENQNASLFRNDVVCLDVLVNHIQEITEQINVAGEGYGLVIDPDGFVIAHHDKNMRGQKFSDIFDSSIVEFADEQFDTELDGQKCTLYTHAIMEKWLVIIVVSNSDLLDQVHSQLAVNILISLIMFFLITFFYYFGYRIEQYNNKKVESLNMEVVSALAEAIDAKDTYTNGHSSRVAKYSKMISARLGYPETEQNEIYMMGLLHDVGKIGVPDEVINKPGKLTDEEFALIKQHPVIGSKILGSIKENPRLATGARWHHERYDGRGYPDGLAGEAIPEEARIIAVADAYDAMTSRRSYRGVMPQEQVRAEIEKGIGTQFDPQFGKIMLSLIDEDTDYTMHEN